MTRIVNGEIVRDDVTNENNGEDTHVTSNSSNRSNISAIDFCTQRISFFGYQIPKYSLAFIGVFTLMIFGFNGLFGLGLLAGCHYLYSNSGGANNGNSGGYQPVSRGSGNTSRGGSRITTISDLPKPPPKG